MKSSKGMIPTGYANGGKVKPFTGKDTKAEEMEEAKQVRSGRLSAKDYADREAMEEKAEGEKVSRKEMIAKGKAIASGKLSPAAYAAQAKMSNGGKVRKYADGGVIRTSCEATGGVSAKHGNYKK